MTTPIYLQGAPPIRSVAEQLKEKNALKRKYRPFEWKNMEIMMWWMDTKKRREFFLDWGDREWLFNEPLPVHIRRWMEQSEYHLSRNPRFQLFNFLQKNGITPFVAAAFVMNNKEMKGEPYDAKAWEDINGMIRKAKELSNTYPTYDAYDRAPENPGSRKKLKN